MAFPVHQYLGFVSLVNAGDDVDGAVARASFGVDERPYAASLGTRPL